MENKSQIRVFSALAVRASFVEIEAEWKKRYPETLLEIEWSPTTVIEKKIASGETADVVILTDPAMDKLLELRLVTAATCIKLVDSLIGLAMLPDAKAPDISTVDAFKSALLSARSVAYSLGGASGVYLQQLMRRLGIEDKVNSQATTIPEGFTATKLLDGSADIAVQQISELLSIEGVKVIGPFPDEIQKTTSFSVGIFRHAENPVGALTLLEFLRSEQARAAYESFGLHFRT